MANKQTVLRFVLSVTDHPLGVMSRFHPQGRTVLNRTEWRGKEPRSCAVTTVKGRPFQSNSKEPMVFDLEVAYRPKGCITYTGNTKYDGWTALMLDRKKDGTLLDGHGQPLPEGSPPVYLPFEMYDDVEFNEIDFGEFVGEFDVGVRHFTYDEVIQEVQKASRINMSINSRFVAARKHRPRVKVILSNAPSGTWPDGWGTKIINVNNLTPHLNQVLIDQITELVSGFIEGRYTLTTTSTDDFVFVELDDILVDCTPNEAGKESRFNILKEYVPGSFLEDMAKILMAVYAIEVSVVDGAMSGLLLKHIKPND